MKTLKINLKWVLAAAFAGTLFASPLLAADGTDTGTNVDIQTLEKQIQALDQEVRELKHQQYEDQQSVVKAQPRLSAGADGINFSSANSNFVAGLHGVLQVDSRTFFQNGQIPGIDGFLLRRARIIFQGTVYHNFDYFLMPEFAGNSPQILDAYLNYRNRPELQLQAGKFKPPVGLEALQSDVNLSFNERTLATDLVPYRGIGAELHGDIYKGAYGYQVGIFNGLPDLNTSTINTNFNNNMAFAGRIFAQPLKNSSIVPLQGLGVGLSGTYEQDQPTTAGLTPGYTTDGQEKFFTYLGTTLANGTHWRISPQAYYYWGPLGLMGEYVVSDQEVSRTTPTPASADIHNTAWEVTGGWVLTGESATYNGVIPRHPFDPLSNDWGAVQLVGRFAQLHIDDDAFPLFANPTLSASGASAWSVGLNWYLNRNIRANLSFSHTWFAGEATANPITAKDENVLFTRMQLAF
ncbi:MAG TPA: porin [Pseudomonadales bacterium]|nr:porin [Pseudomonadales bacterium]